VKLILACFDEPKQLLIAIRIERRVTAQEAIGYDP
jgi:hypothetical protein